MGVFLWARYSCTHDISRGAYGVLVLMKAPPPFQVGPSFLEERTLNLVQKDKHHLATREISRGAYGLLVLMKPPPLSGGPVIPGGGDPEFGSERQASPRYLWNLTRCLWSEAPPLLSGGPVLPGGKDFERGAGCEAQGANPKL